MRRLALSLTAFLCVSTARAAETAKNIELSDYHRRQLSAAIAFHLRPDEAPKSRFSLDYLSPRAAILELYVKELVANLEGGGGRIRPKRVDEALARLTGLIVGMDEPGERQRVRPLIEDGMDRLLALVVGPSAARKSLLAAFHHLGLVSHRNVWFFEQIRSKDDLTEAAPVLLQLLEIADDADREAIATMLRAQPERSLLNHALLAKTGLMREEELVKFFKGASVKFAKVLEHPSMEDETIDIMEDRRHRIVRDQMRAFSEALAGGRDRAVASAFTKAVAKAEAYAGKKYKRESRLLFFQLFSMNEVQWDDRASWRERAAEIQKVELTSYAEVSGDVRLVRFAARCRDSL